MLTDKIRPQPRLKQYTKLPQRHSPAEPRDLHVYFRTVRVPEDDTCQFFFKQLLLEDAFCVNYFSESVPKFRKKCFYLHSLDL